MWKNINTNIKYDEAGVRAQYPNNSLLSFTEPYLETLGYVWEPDPPTVPDSVPMAEARKIMRKAGVLEPVRALVAAAGPDAADDFEYQPRIRRKHPLVLGAIARGIMTAQQADELFIQAAKLAGQTL